MKYLLFICKLLYEFYDNRNDVMPKINCCVCVCVSLISAYRLQNETDLHRFLIHTLTRPQYTLAYVPLHQYIPRYLFSLYVTAA